MSCHPTQTTLSLPLTLGASAASAALDARWRLSALISEPTLLSTDASPGTDHPNKAGRSILRAQTASCLRSEENARPHSSQRAPGSTETRLLLQVYSFGLAFDPSQSCHHLVSQRTAPEPISLPHLNLTPRLTSLHLRDRPHCFLSCVWETRIPHHCQFRTSHPKPESH